MSRSDTTERDDETTDALKHLIVVTVTLASMVLLAYIIPAFHRFRPWMPGDDVPLRSLFEPATEQYTFAGTGNAEEELPNDTTEAVREVAPAAVVTPREPEEPAIEIAPEAYAGLEIHIEDPTGRGMAPFYEALERTALGELGEGSAITRIAHYGDSSIATDHITYTVRRHLQQRFGDAGHGFVLIAKGYLPYRHRDVKVSASESWMLREITRNHVSNGLYGLGGIQFRGRPGAWARFSTDDEGPVGNAVSRFEILYQRYRRGGEIHYRVDGGERRVIDTRSTETEDASLEIEVPDGEHRLEVRFGGHGQPRLYGVIMEREGPGVVYDSIGLVGARAARLLYFDPEHIAAQLERRGTNLLILGFGGNEAGDRIVRERYEPEFREVIRRMRGEREDLGCLVFAPLDQGERDERGRVRTMSTIPTIVESQRAAAFAEGCAFFDTWNAMGGEDTLQEWLRMRPRLASGDLRHMTPAGYELVANLFYKALLEGFAAHLAADEEVEPDVEVEADVDP